VTKRAEVLVKSSFGCQVMTETLLEAHSEASVEQRAMAKMAVARLANGDPAEENHVAQNAHAGRMLKTLVLGGAFDPASKTTKLSEPRLGFAEVLYPIIREKLVEWACSPSSFVVVALLESEDVDKTVSGEVRTALEKGLKKIKAAATAEDGTHGKSKLKEGEEKIKAANGKGNAGARILLERLSG